MKCPAQGAALIGLAIVSPAFFPASSGICIMSEVGLEITLPSSILTKVPQSSDSWAIFLEGTRMSYKYKMVWAPKWYGHPWGSIIAGDCLVSTNLPNEAWLNYSVLLKRKKLMFVLKDSYRSRWFCSIWSCGSVSQDVENPCSKEPGRAEAAAGKWQVGARSRGSQQGRVAAAVCPKHSSAFPFSSYALFPPHKVSTTAVSERLKPNSQVLTSKNPSSSGNF